MNTAPRYTVQKQSDGDYCVWDSEADGVATSADGAIRYANLEEEEAFDEADDLNNSVR
jgi:hypothetical protein